MDHFVLYALLGIGAGAVYSLLGNGIVATYKGSGILNIAQGSFAMIGAYCFVSLVDTGLPKYAALALVLVGAAVFGALFSYLLIRPLREVPVLAKLVVTIALFVAMQGLVLVVWGLNFRIAPRIFPADSVSVLGGVLSTDRIYIAITAIVVSLLLASLYRFTRFGLAVRANAENERGAALLGMSPDVISAASWAIGSSLAALGGVLIAPLSALDPVNMPLLVLPALATALFGRFSSFLVSTIAAFVVGCTQSLLVEYWTQIGVGTAAPFVLVILAMIVTGKLIPIRGSDAAARPPVATSARSHPVFPISFVGLAVVLLLVFPTKYVSALSTSFITAIWALSLVVLVGYVGQISLMQLTFAGLGGFATAKLATDFGVPFPLSIIVAALIMFVVGALLGLPALRVRGLSLAVVTLGAAISVDAVFVGNPDWSGGLTGVPVPKPRIFGASLDRYQHPLSFGIFTLVALVLCAMLVAGTRRSALGRKMLAVRGNERAAAASGIAVARVKLLAFGMSSAIAAVGGGVYAYSVPYITFGEFATSQSILLVSIVYIGGIASLSGAIVAGLVGNGCLLYAFLLSEVGGFSEYYALVSGVLLAYTVVLQPDGFSVFFLHNVKRRVSDALRGLRDGATAGPAGSGKTSMTVQDEPAGVQEASTDRNSAAVMRGTSQP